ncbi:hypothetical protein [Pseudomonas caspiana]|uniref:Uncharacterized protein n=1 Tax=Pseudomonas caspiana TaxID=1451454 RepID=A0A1Y3NZU9_9PSED|nr:hypothetical protein [Pseudomonas caspiana]OUM70823.1 hypothetical protein AUC60_26595 [Pseudomonas caspiana]
MDHQLIDRALDELTSTPAEARTPEVIQAWARFICVAAGADIESTTPIYSDWVELRASVALLAAELDSARYSVSIDAYFEEAPALKAFIFTDKTTALYGYGSTAEKVLQRLKEDSKSPRPKEAA